MKNHIKYGLILCLMTVICLGLMELTGNNASFDAQPWYQAAIQMILPIFVFVFAIKDKKKEQGGILTWKQGVLEGFKTSLVFAIISPFIFLAYYMFVNSAIVASIQEAYMLENVTNAQVIGIDMIAQFVFALVFGLMISMITSLFLKNKNNA